MRRTRTWKIRAMAWVAVVPTALLPLLWAPAQAQQLKANQKAHERPLKSELPAGRTDKLTAAQWQTVDAKRAKAEEAARPEVRILSAAEMQHLSGRGPYRNKYFAGTLPWHRSLRDANLCNGNLFKSFTDIQVSPAKGAGLAMQRTYNSQDDRIGPFRLNCVPSRSQDAFGDLQGVHRLEGVLPVVEREDAAQGGEVELAICHQADHALPGLVGV